MDLHAAVAVSMIGLSRTRVCSVFRELRQHRLDISVETLIEALQVDENDRRRLIDEARSRADSALSCAASAEMEAVPWFDSRYSALLNCVPDPPPVLCNTQLLTSFLYLQLSALGNFSVGAACRMPHQSIPASSCPATI